MTGQVSIIAVDGPSGSGKGTICQLLATRLGYHYLDSGAMYRLLALAAKRHKVALDDVEDLAVLAAHMDISFRMNSSGGHPEVILEGEDVTQQIRSEDISAGSSLVAAIPAVRMALLERQRAFASAPGLVADGRDMGTVVFPDAPVKIFLNASPEERAKRRYNQLMDKGESVSLAALVENVRSRDERDMTREVSPLVPAQDAVEIDTTGKDIQEVLNTVLDIVRTSEMSAQRS
ncbi:MAG: cytidylate kinase [Gammaproteobacteria bacterium BRH_c0]|nr:MAG: cytidylate kinase [Gammaproteobacteria bacterium BRH_c0]